MPLVSCDADASINGVTWPKGHVAPHFSCLDVRNAMLPLMMQSASCDTNDIILPKVSCGTSFWSAWCKEYNDAIHADDGANDITWPNKSCITSFWSTWKFECSCTIDDASDGACGGTLPKMSWYMSFWLFYVWNIMAPVMMPTVLHDTGTSSITWPKEPMLHFILIVVIKGMPLVIL